jgi:hypothetical protein
MFVVSTLTLFFAMMKAILPLVLVGAIASGCNSQPAQVETPSETPTSSETASTPSEDTVDTSSSQAETAFVNFTVDVTTGIYAEPDANVTGLKGFYRYNPSTNELENVLFFDQASNDISEYCTDMTLASDGMGLNGKCVLPGGEYAFGNAVTDATASSPYAFSYVFDAGPGGEGVGVVTYEPVANPPSSAEEYPEVATVQELVQGDLMCYATLSDANGKEYSVGATFELCEQRDRVLNQTVSLKYDTLPVQDCQSNEPCGRIRIERLIVAMDAVEQ